MDRYSEALDAFTSGLKLEPENTQLLQGLQQVSTVNGLDLNKLNIAWQVQLALKSAPIKKGVWGQMLAPYNSTQPYPIVWNM